MQPMKYQYNAQEINLHDLQLPSDYYYTLPAIKQNLLGAINLISDDGEVDPTLIQSR